MKKLLVLLGAAPLLLAAAHPDLKLNDGRVLKSARIVAIGQEVSIVYAGGMTSELPENVPLDVLARADMQLKAEAAERAKSSAAVAERVAAEDAKGKAAREEEIRVRLAMANARARAQGDADVAVPPKTGRNVDAELAKLRASLPKHPAASSSDPMIRECIGKYSRAFSAVRPDTISQTCAWLRNQLVQDIDAAQRTLATTKAPTTQKPTATSSARTAAQSNLAWMRQISAHAAKLEALAR